LWFAPPFRAALLEKPWRTAKFDCLGWDANFSDDWKESSSARPKGSLDSKPTRRKTSGFLASSAFFVLGDESFFFERLEVCP
jgi:hypothetical protein